MKIKLRFAVLSVLFSGLYFDANGSCDSHKAYLGKIDAVSKKISYEYWGFYPYTQPSADSEPTKYKKQKWRGTMTEFPSPTDPIPSRRVYFSSLIEGPGAESRGDPIPDGTIIYSPSIQAASIDKALIARPGFGNLPSAIWMSTPTLLSVIANYEGANPSPPGSLTKIVNKVTYAGERMPRILTNGVTVYRSWNVTEELSEPLTEADIAIAEARGAGSAVTGNSNVAYDKGARLAWTPPSLGRMLAQ